MFIDDSGKISVRELVARSRTAIKRDGVKIIVVDYLRLIEGPGKELREKIAGVTNSLRELAKAENVAVLALSQLSRPRDGNVNSEPTMLSLKESGDIEAHAHTVILSHMPLDDYGHPSGEEKLIIAKQRNGPCGPVTFATTTTCFALRGAHEAPQGAVGSSDPIPAVQPLRRWIAPRAANGRRSMGTLCRTVCMPEGLARGAEDTAANCHRKRKA